MSYQIFDLETTIKQSYKRKANCFDEDNWVVACVYKRPGQDSIVEYYGKDKAGYVTEIPEDCRMLVGFNIKFDLLYSWNQPALQAFLKRGGRIWDCQYAEYLLEGQQPHAQMCSMDDIILDYGGELKVDEVKAMWQAGISTEEIPEDLLIHYAHRDGKNTELIFLGQLERAKKQGQAQDILQRMEGLLCTTEMEANGLFVDVAQAEQDRELLLGELEKINEILTVALPELPPELEFNWGSHVMKSCLLFGGTVKYEKWTPHLDEEGNQLYAQKDVQCIILEDGRRIPQEVYDNAKDTGNTAVVEAIDAAAVRYKGGKNAGLFKTKKVKTDDRDKPKGAKKDYGFAFKGYTSPRPEWKGALTDFNGDAVYSTSGEIIAGLHATGIPFLQALANREKIAKDLGTYYWMEDDKGKRKGMLTCVMPDSIIHHKLNHDITITSRLSSSDPNLQNIPRDDFDKLLGRAKSLVKRMFKSRFGTAGIMVEIDYSQLEVVVQGLLSGDPQLIKDICAGVDFHCKRLSAKLKEDYDHVVNMCKVVEDPVYKQMRTQIKGFTFQRAYGAGVTGIAASTGMSEDEVRELIDVEEKLYPGITKFYDAVQASCVDSRWPTMVREPLPDKPAVYVQCGRGHYKTVTQARFVFTEVPLQKYARRIEGKDTGFYRPAIQNYPVQGVGGQLVQYVLGKLIRHFINNENYNGNALLVNTVHDCVWFDCANEQVAKRMVGDVVPIMESIPEILRELFDIDCPVPFPVEAEMGKDMMSLGHVN